MSIQEIEGALGPLIRGQEGVPDTWASDLAGFLAHLRERNQRVNLVSRASIDQLVEKQVVPSLAVLRVVPPNQPIRVLDVGTGGGFPGIPLKILRPAVRLDLMDATRKKCEFLEDAVAQLGLTDVRIHWGRAEAPPPDLQARAPFDLLVARAVGAPALLEEAARQLLAPDGSAWRFVAPHEKPDDLPWPEDGPAVTALRRI